MVSMMGLVLAVQVMLQTKTVQILRLQVAMFLRKVPQYFRKQIGEADIQADRFMAFSSLFCHLVA